MGQHSSRMIEQILRNRNSPIQDQQHHEETNETEESGGDLKLAAQKVTEFQGGNDEWRKWKNKTECALEGSGYNRILTDHEYASRNRKMNKIVYSQLAAATIDGCANHLVTQYSDSKDGHAAWNALMEWYDGDIVRAETADELRSKLTSLTLHPGTSASNYINKFLIWFRDLNKIPGEEYSNSHGISLFLRNIHDPDYTTTTGILKTSNEMDLMKCVTAIRKRERELLRSRSEKRKLHQHIKRLRNEGLLDDETPSRPQKVRRMQDTITLQGEIELTKDGYIHLENDTFANLDSMSKEFVKKYNGNVKRGVPMKESEVPSGIIIRTKANRLTPAPPNDDSDSPNDSDVSFKQSTKKRIQFNLQGETIPSP